MARRRIPSGEIEGVIRSWHSGVSIWRSSRAFGLSRKTGQAYIRKAQAMGVQRGATLPPLGPLLKSIYQRRRATAARAPLRGTAHERLEPHIEWIRGKLEDSGQKPGDVWKDLRTERECNVSYSSFKRYVRARVLGNGLGLARAREFYESLLRAPHDEAVR